jgi:hypothetical protein
MRVERIDRRRDRAWGGIDRGIQAPLEGIEPSFDGLE